MSGEEKDIEKNNSEKSELKFKVTLDSDKRNIRISDNIECYRKCLSDREDSNREMLKNNEQEVKAVVEKDHPLSSIEKKTFALPSSQFHARFADTEDYIDNEDVIERANSPKNIRKNVVKQTSSNTSHTKTIDSIVSPQRHLLNSQKSNNTIPSSVEFKTSTIRQHYYPEGLWGWVVVVLAMFCNIITFGLQLSFGVFLIHLIKQPFGRDKYMPSIWLGSLSLGVSYFMSPILVSWCRKKSARLTAIAGGLVSSLGCLFASFASQYHQVVLSYGVFMSIGIGIARESSNLMVGQYFKRKRNFVEILVQSSIGIGVALMSPFLNWSIGFKHWRAGLQLITCALFATFIIAILYRPASLYHPQRRAILHLKTQRRKIREKNPQTNKPPFFDLTSLKIRSVRIILVSTVLFSFGYLTPIFYLTSIVRIQNHTVLEQIVHLPDGVIPSSVINLHIYFGISFAIGVILCGFLTVIRSAKCRINRQYLCQTSMVFTVLLLISSIYLNHYNGYVIFVIAYGISVGSFHYTNKMLVFSLVRAKTFSKAMSYVRFGQSFAILIGIPFTGHINNWFDANSYHYGFIFSATLCLAGSLVLFALNPESDNLLPNNHILQTFQQHSCNTFEINKFKGMTANHAAINYSRSSDSCVTQTEHNCCNCGEKLLLNDDNDGFKENHSMKVDECRPPSPKRSRTVDNEEDDDLDFIYNKLNVPDLATFYSDDLCNYYLQNDGEQVMALCDPELVKEKSVLDNEFECEITKIDYSQPRKLLICDNTEVKQTNPLRRTIETVTEETLSMI